MADCPACMGTGRASAIQWPKVRTIRAGLSLWERVLTWVGMEPDPDCAPDVRKDGSVPMVEEYLKLYSTAELSGRVARWSPVRRGGDGWEVRTVIRVSRGTTEADEGRLFTVKDREIKTVVPCPRDG